MAGLGPAAARQWRWRAELAERLEAGPAIPGICLVPGGPPGVLAGFSLNAAGGLRRECIAAVVGLARRGGSLVRGARPRLPHARGCRAKQGDIRARRAQASGCHPRAGAAGPRPSRKSGRAPLDGAPARNRPSGLVATRLHQAIRDAARRRDVGALQRLEAAPGLRSRWAHGRRGGTGATHGGIVGAGAREPNRAPACAVLEARSRSKCGSVAW